MIDEPARSDGRAARRRAIAIRNRACADARRVHNPRTAILSERQPPMQNHESQAALRLQRRGVKARREAIEILVDGRPLPAFEGETVGAALAAAGCRSLRMTSQGEPRGLYCGMGVCFECRLSIDGRPGERACLTAVRPGMRIELARTAHGEPVPQAQTPVEPAFREERTQLLVLGAGPAGLAAAEAAAARGVQVTILDERPAPGGQYFKPLAKSHRNAGGEHAHVDRQFARGAELVARVQALGVRMLSGVTVWDAQALPEGGGRVQAHDAQGQAGWQADKLVVATGAYERAWAVPGWTLPGVITTGAAQTLARAYQVAPGRRVLFAGNGPLNLQVAADLARHGVQVVALAEAAASPWKAPLRELLRAARLRPDLMRDGLGYLRTLRRHAVPVLHGHVLLRVEGRDRVERAVLAALDADGAPLAGSERSYAVDTVCMGYGFAPASELTRLLGCRHETDARNGIHLVAVRDAQGRTSIADVYAAGDAGGPWGAHAALHQGRLAGLAAAEALGKGADPDGQARAQAGLARERAFQRSLWAIHAMPDPGERLADDATTLCRCENVAHGAVRAEIASGATDLAAIKRATRCGMGHCQGRYCSPLIARMLAARTGVRVDERTHFRVQAPLRPLAMDALARVQPDIARFGELPADAVDAADAPPSPVAAPIRTGTLVIGAGIVGLCTARELALAGEDVIVLERNQPHAEASGANAGSLHVQFQTFGFPDLHSREAVRAPVSTLALQRDSVNLWAALAAGLGVDIEVAIEGGLTVADDAASLAHLQRKVELEREAGLQMEMLSGEQARALAPWLSPAVIAASLSRDEGKINPLKAAPALRAAAAAAGARIEARTRVLAISHDASGFTVRTDRGSFLAARVVNAAGAWAGAVAALAGDTLPVRQNPIQMLVTEAMPPVIPYHLAHATRRLTLKQAANGNLIVGGGWKAAWDPHAGRTRPTLQGVSGNLAVVLRMLPGLGALQVIRSWTGVAFVTPPAIGASPRLPGLYHAVVQNGMTLGPAIGRAGAALVLGRAPEHDLSAFSPARFG